MSFIQKFFSFIFSIFIAVSPATQFTEGVVGQPSNFLPSLASQQIDRTVSKLIFRSLFRYDIYGTLVPDLAESWSISEDGTVYTIKIKDNQYWTDGHKVNADDLIYTAFNLPDLAGVGTDKVDELTVRYILPNKYSPFLSLMTAGIMHENSIEDGNFLEPITNGDFEVIKVERVGSQIKSVTLGAKNDSFKIKKLKFRFYANESELATAAKLGEIDAFMADRTYEFENFENYRFPVQGIYYSLVFNLREDKLNDLDLRQKMEKVLPVEQLILERGIEVEGPISRSVFTDKNLEFNKYDPEFSESLGDISIVLTVPNTEEHLELGNNIKDIWESQLDLDIELRQVPLSDIVNRVIVPRNFEVLLYGQEIGRDPDRYVYWHSTQTDSPNLNISGFEQVRVDRSLEEGRNEQDNEKRVTHYNEFQTVVMEQVPAIFLYHPYKNYYVSKYIKGISDKYTFTTYDRFLDFGNWERVVTN